MYIDKSCGVETTIYETLDDLLELKLNQITEYNGCYYIQPKGYPGSDGSFWKVDKKTEKASYFGAAIAYALAGLLDKATPVDIDNFLKERKRRSA